VETSTVQRWHMHLPLFQLALTDLVGISERRVDRLVNPDVNEGLPAFLSSGPGVAYGLMIPKVIAVALLNECKILAHPASTDNVPTSGAKKTMSQCE
jgi:histidine ammonia-lyase